MTPDTQRPPTRSQTVLSLDGTPISFHTTGAGPGLIVLGGSLRAAEDYLALALALARSFTVHVVDRRGRGASGDQGPHYGLQREVEDLLAVQAATGARMAFGHSYGGLVVLEIARCSQVFDRIVTYEPGVPVRPVATSWMGPYRQRLAAGDPYGAFAHFIRGSGGAPAIMAALPHWYLRLVLRIGFRGRSWQRMLPLLEANVAEHEQVAAHWGRLDEFAAVRASVLILCGERSARDSKAEFLALRNVLPDASMKSLKGLDHFGPEGKLAAVVAESTASFLSRGVRSTG